MWRAATASGLQVGLFDSLLWSGQRNEQHSIQDKEKYKEQREFEGWGRALERREAKHRCCFGSLIPQLCSAEVLR